MPLLRLIRHIASRRQRFMYGFMMLCIASAVSPFALPLFKESALGVPGRLCSSSSGPELKLFVVVAVPGCGPFPAPDVEEAKSVRDAEADLLLLVFGVRVRGCSSIAEASCGAPGYFRCTAFPGAEGSSRGGVVGALSTAIRPRSIIASMLALYRSVGQCQQRNLKRNARKKFLNGHCGGRKERRRFI